MSPTGGQESSDVSLGDDFAEKSGRPPKRRAAAERTEIKSRMWLIFRMGLGKNMERKIGDARTGGVHSPRNLQEARDGTDAADQTTQS